MPLEDRLAPAATPSAVFPGPAGTGDDPAFGQAVAVSGDLVLVGAPNEDQAGLFDVGAAYLFNAASGQFVRRFANPEPDAADTFGSSVAFDGATILIGAPGPYTEASPAGAAYVFDSAGNFVRKISNPAPARFEFFGAAVALDAGNALVGAPVDTSPDAGVGGAAFLFTNSGALFQTFVNPSPGVGDFFGGSLALEGGGVLVGASGDDLLGDGTGRAYLFNADGNLLQAYNNPAPGPVDSFGASVALDSGNVLIGSPRTNGRATDTGAAYLFGTTSPSVRRTYQNPVPTSGALFGASVALEGTRMLVGAPLAFAGRPAAGRAFLFETGGGLTAQFRNPDPARADAFGSPVAVTSRLAVIAAPGDDPGGAADVGTVSVYGFDGSVVRPTAQPRVWLDASAVSQMLGDDPAPGRPGYYARRGR